MSGDLRLALRLLWREAKSGELRLLFVSLLIAVASFSSVGFFADRVRGALEAEATQLLGADLLLVADHPPPPSYADAARAAGLMLAETRTFPSMISTLAGAQLAEVKAVSASYPLRGRLRIADALNAADRQAGGVPEPGTVWVDERLASAVGALPGSELQVGESRLRVAQILTLEPDRGMNFFGIAPRLLMNLGDLEATRLIRVGSRVAYRLLVAGEPKAVDQYRRWALPQLGRGERIEDTQAGRPEIRSALDRAQRFLGLAALLAVVMAAAGVALSTRRYVQRHLDPFAVMRCLGATQPRLLRLALAQFVVLGLTASLAGLLVGYLAHFALHASLASLLATVLPSPGFAPAGQGIAIGMALLFAFALPPLLQLRRVPTLRVLRRELGAPERGALIGWLFGAAILAGLMFWVAGEPKLGTWVVGGFVGALAGFTLGAWGAIRLMRRLARNGGRWRVFAGLARRPLTTMVQMVALAIGFMALILLTVTRNELLEAWQRTVPSDAPNRFVINIQPEQREPVSAFLAAQGVSAELLPMVRGRLVSLNGRPIGDAAYADERAKRLIEREFNLSWAGRLPDGNRVVAGRWFSQDDRGQSVISVEDGIAKTLGLKIGDEMVWQIAGETLKSRIVGLRHLNWDSMRVNFFVMFPTGVIEPFPKSFITSFHLPPTRPEVVNELVRTWPNLTVIDVTAILRQLRSVTDQVSRAVQFVFVFAFAAGIVVLYAALLAAFDERRQELAVMRALGAQRKQLRRLLLAEFATIGGLAGVGAALAAMALGFGVSHALFDIEMLPNLWLVPAAALVGALAVAVAGAGAVTRLLALPPVEALRLGD